MREEEFRSLYEGTWTLPESKAIEVNSRDEAVRYAIDNGFGKENTKYITRMEQLFGIDRNWRKNMPPLLLAVRRDFRNPVVINEAYRRGFFEDD